MFENVTPEMIINDPVKDCTNCGNKINIGSILGRKIFSCNQFFKCRLNEGNMWREEGLC